jgi:hypothetical protein
MQCASDLWSTLNDFVSKTVKPSHFHDSSFRQNNAEWSTPGASSTGILKLSSSHQITSSKASAACCTNLIQTKRLLVYTQRLRRLLLCWCMCVEPPSFGRVLYARQQPGFYVSPIYPYTVRTYTYNSIQIPPANQLSAREYIYYCSKPQPQPRQWMRSRDPQSCNVYIQSIESALSELLWRLKGERAAVWFPGCSDNKTVMTRN